ncbi:MAG TPA: hypothetical protein VIR31_00075 [Nitrososphaeraceae archaeon]
MSIKDLILNSEGKISHTKAWTNIAYAAATYKFMVQDAQPDIWLIYLGVVGAHGLLSKAVSIKYGGGASA